MYALLHVHEEQHDVALDDGQLDLGPDGSAQRVVRAGHHASRVHQPKPPAVPLHRAEVPIPRDPRLVVHDCLPAADQAVEERGLADVGPADDGDRGGAPPRPTHGPSPTPERGTREAERGTTDRAPCPKSSTLVPRSAFRLPRSTSTSAKS